MKIEWRQVVVGSCDRYAYVPAGAVIEAVDGREVDGICEVCGMPVFDDEDYIQDSEGVIWHKNHETSNADE